MKNRYSKSVTIMLAALLAGCTTVKMPNIDFLKLPEFADDAKNIKSYPKVSDAPAAPTEVRNGEAWDAAALSLIQTRDTFDLPKSGKTYDSDSQVNSEMRSLKEEVRAYKLDDPQ